MSDKALLVMDTPENCEECPFCDFVDYTCGVFGIIEKNFTYEIPEDGVADWCPLKPMQDKKNFWSEGYGGKFSEGWNACIDKILGEEK